jgi:hypothetical protein
MTDPNQALRDRVLSLEFNQQAMLKKQEVTGEKVDEMHELLTRAKGAKWVGLILLTTLASIGGYIANVIVTFLNPPPH